MIKYKRFLEDNGNEKAAAKLKDKTLKMNWKNRNHQHLRKKKSRKAFKQ